MRGGGDGVATAAARAGLSRFGDCRDGDENPTGGFNPVDPREVCDGLVRRLVTDDEAESKEGNDGDWWRVNDSFCEKRGTLDLDRACPGLNLDCRVCGVGGKAELLGFIVFNSFLQQSSKVGPEKRTNILLVYDGKRKGGKALERPGRGKEQRISRNAHTRTPRKHNVFCGLLVFSMC